MSSNDTPRSNYSSVTKSYRPNTTVAVRWHRPIAYQGLIKLISKFVTLFINTKITVRLAYAMHGVGLFYNTNMRVSCMLSSRRSTRAHG